ncbi:MAG: FAD-dependent oxidoreductase [Bacillota bacterium]
MKTDERLMKLENSYGDWWKKGFPVPEMTNALYPYTELFSPIRVNRLTLKNRLVMAPMGNISMCDETGRPNDKMLKYFEERAKGGVGLITTGLIPVSFGIDKSLQELGDLTYFPRIDRSRTVYAGWRDLAMLVHSHGSHIFVQLTAGMGRVGNPQCLVNSKKFPRSASFNSNFYMKEVPCLPLSDRSLNRIIKNLGQGAADAKASNLDGVYLHGHEGYLLEQLTNSAFNRRKFGRFADIERFGVEAIREIRKRVGKNFPIMYRIDLSLMLNETYGDRMDKEKALKKYTNGRTIEQSLEYMKHLVEAGVDLFDVDLGCYDNWWLPHPPATMPSGCFLGIAEITKRYFDDNHILSNAGVKVPVVAVGKLGYPDLAESALRAQMCDMIMLGRPLLADPYWPEKAYKGQCEKIRPCMGCQEACINEFVEGGHLQCAVNPRTAFEDEFTEEIEEARNKKRIAVVGAGPAGIVAAKTLIQRGHKVDLYEKNDQIGGNLLPGSAAVIKYELKNYLKYLNHVIEDLKDSANFRILLSTEATEELLKAEKYDAIFFAAGSSQGKPPVRGIDADNVLFAVDVLLHPELVKDAKDIVVVGGGVVGAETAYFLSYELGKNVTVIEMDKYIMNHVCTANRGHLIHYLEKNKVDLYNCTKLKEVIDGFVVVDQNTHKNVPDPYLTWTPILPENVENPMEKKIGDQYVEKKLKADVVLLAAGVMSNQDLYQSCVKHHVADEIYHIGDCFRSARIFEAVRAAYRKARSV